MSQFKLDPDLQMVPTVKKGQYTVSEVDFERNVVFDGRKEEKIRPRIYIVANKEQELAVLGSLENEGFKWMDNDRPQEWLPSKEIFSEFGFSFPYTIVAYKDKTITWSYSLEYPKGSAEFDGRKEEKMTEVKKYKVTKEKNMLWIVLLDIVVGAIIVGLCGLILVPMLTSGSLVLTIVGVVLTVVLFGYILWSVYQDFK